MNFMSSNLSITVGFAGGCSPLRGLGGSAQEDEKRTKLMQYKCRSVVALRRFSPPTDLLA
jgi:hypothetical protein